MGNVSVIHRNGEVHGYSACIGRDERGKRIRRFFKNREDAERHVHSEGLKPLSVEELWERRTELVYTLERIRRTGVELNDVVTFFLEHRHSVTGQTKLSVLVTDFLREKLQVGRSQHYDRTMRQCFLRFMKTVGQDRVIGTITTPLVTDYVYRVHKHTSPTTKRNIIRNLSVLFNFAVRKDLLEKNPFQKIDRPTVPFTKPHVLTPAEFEKLLRICVRKKWSERLVIYVLVGFCGIRVEEASRLRWSNLHLDKGIVEVPAEVAKKAAFRNNPIPPNAMTWLRLVEDKRRTGPIIGPRWMIQLRSVVKAAKIDYRKNCIRHSFCSYAIASGWSLADVIAYMGHGGGPAMVHSHYRNVVSPEDGKKWFSLTP